MLLPAPRDNSGEVKKRGFDGFSGEALEDSSVCYLEVEDIYVLSSEVDNFDGVYSVVVLHVSLCNEAGIVVVPDIVVVSEGVGGIDS